MGDIWYYVLICFMIGLAGCILLLIYSCCKVASWCDEAEERQDAERRIKRLNERKGGEEK